MTQPPKLTERIVRLEEAILEIHEILSKKDNIVELLSQLKRTKTTKTVTSDAPAPAPVADVPAPVEAPLPAPAQVLDETPVAGLPVPTGAVSESFVQVPVSDAEEPLAAPSLPSKPSLTMVLSSLSPTSVRNEHKIVKKYLEHVDAFLEDHPTDEGISIDYRVLAVTLEFVSVAEKELKYLTNSIEATRAMCTQATIWLLNTYKEHNSAVALALPSNLELLIGTVYDVILCKYLIKAPEELVVPNPKKHNKWALSWSTFKKRWSHHKDPPK